jgi:hypothetical protein
MESFTATELEWQDILGCLPLLTHPTIRDEVIMRLVKMVMDQATGNPDNEITLELDDAGAVAVRRARHMSERADGPSDEAAAAIAEAEAIIREHQKRA